MIAYPKLLGKRNKKWILEVDRKFKKKCLKPALCSNCKERLKKEFYFCTISQKFICKDCENKQIKLEISNVKSAIDTCGYQKNKNHQYLLIKDIKLIGKEEVKKLLLT